MLIVRELLLGPLRFSELARCVGGAPTDILTRRLRDLEQDGIVRRRELGPPASGTVYELTEVGAELEGTVLDLGRWGLNFYRVEELPGLVTNSIANALRIVLRPPLAGDPILLQIHSEGHSNWLRLAAGGASAGRGEAADPDLVLSGSGPDVIAAIVIGGEAEQRVGIEGDPAVLLRLRGLVELPKRLRAEVDALNGVAPPLA